MLLSIFISFNILLLQTSATKVTIFYENRFDKNVVDATEAVEKTASRCLAGCLLY